MKICLVGAESFCVDVWTDRLDEAKVTFHIYANMPKDVKL